MLSHHASSKARSPVSLLCPAWCWCPLSFPLRVLELAAKPERVYRIIQFTWLAGLDFTTQSHTPAKFAADWGSCWIR